MSSAIVLRAMGERVWGGGRGGGGVKDVQVKQVCKALAAAKLSSHAQGALWMSLQDTGRGQLAITLAHFLSTARLQVVGCGGGADKTRIILSSC